MQGAAEARVAGGEKDLEDMGVTESRRAAVTAPDSASSGHVTTDSADGRLFLKCGGTRRQSKQHE